MSERGEDANQIAPEHVEHAVQSIIGSNTGHNWIQRGVEMQCDGCGNHPRHGSRIAPELVFLNKVTEDGDLCCKSSKTGEEVIVKVI